MGLFLTLLYIVVSYLTPYALFGQAAEYHIAEILVGIALIPTVFAAQGSGVLSWRQTWALAGLCLGVGMSIASTGWFGGASNVLIEFAPSVVPFFLVALNCKKKWHLQVMVATLLLIATFIIVQADIAMIAGDNKSNYVYDQGNEDASGVKVSLLRARGLGTLNDPNDLAQFLVALIPYAFIFWVKGRAGRNLALVYLPASIVCYGMFLTHSRGGMVALMVMAFVAFRRKIGVVPAVIGGLIVFAGLTAVGFSGGRDVSAGAGEDRMGAWSVGLTLLRSHPIFGVGYLNFVDYNDITAHNSVVVTAAEIGLFGFFFWTMLLMLTVSSAVRTEKDPDAGRKAREEAARNRFPGLEPAYEEAGLLNPAGHPATLAIAAPGLQQGSFATARSPMSHSSVAGMPVSGFGFDMPDTEEDRAAGDAEMRRISGLVVLSFTGFLTAGWFLSRSYSVILYVYAGFAAAVWHIARDRGIAPPPLAIKQTLKLTAMLCFGLLAVVYIILRVNNLLPH